MIQYWLGELSPEAERRLEDRYFTDDDLFEQLLAVREELFDAYARGELSEADRARFEQHLLQSPEDREELDFARRFAGALDSDAAGNAAAPDPAESPARGSWWSFPRLVWVLGCAALLAGAVWLVSDQLRSRDRLANLPSDRPPTPQPVSSPTPDPSPAPSVAPRQDESPPANTLVVALSSRNLRGTSVQTIQLQPETRTLRCQLLLDSPNAFPSYQLELTRDANAIKRWQKLRSARDSGAELTVDLPIGQLPAGEYSFELRGVNNDGTIEDEGRYSFRLLPQAQTRSSLAAIASIVLRPPGLRDSASGQVPQLTINSDTSSARLTLVVDKELIRMILESYPNVRAELSNGGNIQWTQEGLKPRGTDKAFVVTLPAERLGAGNHQMRLVGSGSAGETVIADYQFKVEKKQ